MPLLTAKANTLCGVPQGLKLGQSLYNLYVSDL